MPLSYRLTGIRKTVMPKALMIPATVSIRIFVNRIFIFRINVSLRGKMHILYVIVPFAGSNNKLRDSEQIETAGGGRALSGQQKKAAP
jgi:hypothetical protein